MRNIFRKIRLHSIIDLFNKLVAGIIIAFILILLCFSLASVLFTGALTPYFPQGVGIMLVSTMIAVAIMGVAHRRYHLLASMQSSLILIIATMAASMTISPTKDLATTVFILLPLTALVTGIAFFIFGQLRLVKFIRYVPYPVIGGFLAGNGLLLILSALQVMTASEWTLSNVLTFFAVDMLQLWVPGAVIGVSLFASLRHQPRYILIPVILLLGVAAIYGWIYSQNLTIADAINRGLLVGDIGAIAYSLPLTLPFSAIDWQAIQSQWANLLTVIMVALIHLPLNLTGIELFKQDDFDIDQQVKTNGIMNVLIALCGGNVGFTSASVSMTNHRIGGNSSLIYLIIIGAILTILIVGSQVLTYIPLALLGSLLIYIGLDFIDSWIIQGLDKFTRSEYIVAFLIMLTVIFVGFLAGVVLGTFVMLIVFVATYSRISNIYRAISAENISSTVERNPHFTEELFLLRQQVYIMELTNFLFFGTGDDLVQQAKQRIDNPNMPPLKHLIIDFRRVAGVDSSALQSLNKIIRLAETCDFDVVFADFDDNPSILRIMSSLSTSERLQFAPNLDRALEQVESSLLEYAGTTQAVVSTIIWMQLADMGMNRKAAKKIRNYMERKKYAPETIIINQGDDADTLYFVEIGKVSIFLDFDTDTPIRLRSIGMGTVVGEIGFFLERQRTATVVSDVNSFIWEMKKDELNRMKAEDPSLAFEFEAMMLKVVAKRLTANNNLLHVLR